MDHDPLTTSAFWVILMKRKNIFCTRTGYGRSNAQIYYLINHYHLDCLARPKVSSI